MKPPSFSALEPIGYFNEEGALTLFNVMFDYKKCRHYIESAGFQLVFAVEQGFKKQRLAYVRDEGEEECP